MALADLAALDQYLHAPVPPGGLASARRLYSPVDQVHEALVALLSSVQHSLVIGMFGLDDESLVAIIKKHLENPNIYVQVTLDKTQAAGVHEHALLGKYLNDCPGNSISIGTSEVGGQIMHLKTGVIDGLDVFDGSTNWSASGEGKQDNSLLILRDPVAAAVTRARLDVIHTAQLQAMAAKRAASPAA